MALGCFRCQVLQDGEVCRDYGWQANLILDQGLDQVATRPWVDCFQYAVAGTSDQSNYLASGATTASQNGATITLSGGSFRFTDTPTDYNKVLKWDSGEEATVTQVTSPTTLRTNVARIKSAGSFRVYLTTQTGMGAEIARSGTYATGPGACGVTLSPGTGTLVFLRSFDFGIPALATTYREVGVSWSGVPGNNLFARVPLATPVVVQPHERLRVIYELTLALSPYVPDLRTFTITGWPVAPATNLSGHELLESWGLYGIDASGARVALQSLDGVPLDSNEPSANGYAVMSTDATALNSFGALPVNRYAFPKSAILLRLDPYSPGTFSRSKTAMVANDVGVSSGIRSLFVGPKCSDTNYPSLFLLRFAQAQTKSPTNIMNLIFRYSWGRILA